MNFSEPFSCCYTFPVEYSWRLAPNNPCKKAQSRPRLAPRATTHLCRKTPIPCNVLLQSHESLSAVCTGRHRVRLSDARCNTLYSEQNMSRSHPLSTPSLSTALSRIFGEPHSVAPCKKLIATRDFVTNVEIQNRPTFTPKPNFWLHTPPEGHLL